MEWVLRLHQRKDEYLYMKQKTIRTIGNKMIYNKVVKNGNFKVFA